VLGAGVMVPFGPVNVVFGATTLVSKRFERENSVNIGISRRFL
jgi:hypothetical protein